VEYVKIVIKYMMLSVQNAMIKHALNAKDQLLKHNTVFFLKSFIIFFYYNIFLKLHKMVLVKDVMDTLELIARLALLLNA